MTATIRKFLSATVRKAQSLCADQSGNIAIMAGVTISLALVLAAFGVDEGALYLQRRHAQSLTDLAAITAAASPEDPEGSARRFLQDNDLRNFYLQVQDGNVTKEQTDANYDAYVTVEPGNYVKDPSIDVNDRFRAGQAPLNAVKVTMRQNGKLYFAKNLLDETPVVQTTGVAFADSQAAFSIGSRLVGLNGGILNALLNGLLGTNLSLSVMDYQSLVNANVDALQFLDALATEVHLTAGTYNDLLKSNVSLGQILTAVASVTKPSDDAANVLLQIASQKALAKVMVPLSNLIDLGSIGDVALGSGDAVLAANLGVMELISASAAVANGEHQVQLNLGAQVPGLVSLTADLAIGEPPLHSPWYRVGDGGEITRTAQTRLYIQATVGGSGILSGLQIRLPIYLELAYGEAKLASVSCPTGRPESAQVDIDARPGVADLWIADVDTAHMSRFTGSPPITNAQILKTPLLSITGLAHVGIGNERYQRVSFDYNDIEGHEAKTVTTQQYLGPLVNSLLGDLDLNVKILGLGIALPPNQIRDALLSLLTPVTNLLDPVIYNLLSALGVGLGQADVWADGVACQRPVLVQ